MNFIEKYINKCIARYFSEYENIAKKYEHISSISGCKNPLDRLEKYLQNNPSRIECKISYVSSSFKSTETISINGLKECRLFCKNPEITEAVDYISGFGFHVSCIENSRERNEFVGFIVIDKIKLAGFKKQCELIDMLFDKYPELFL